MSTPKPASQASLITDTNSIKKVVIGTRDDPNNNIITTTRTNPTSHNDVISTEGTIQPLQFTPLSTIGPMINQVRHNWTRTRALYSIEFRKLQLQALARLVQEQENMIFTALFNDVRKSRGQVFMTETVLVVNEIAEAISSLDSWCKPDYPSRQVINWMDSITIRKDPLGLVLIIGAWNYPFQLTIAPLVAAIAAGNACILKPSELSPATAQVLADLIPKYLDSRFFQVINGGIPETTETLQHKFDHIIYTGNNSVARLVMAAASKHLTPLTLELGGKSPAIVHPSADLRNSARRIVFGKLLNAGQTCIAPDYVLISREQHDAFIHELELAIIQFYGSDPRQSEDYGRIVNERHFDRLANYIPTFDQPIPDSSNHSACNSYGGKIVLGGNPSVTWNRDDRYIPPTLLANVGRDAPIMKDEIFGPILPIIPLDMDQSNTLETFMDEEIDQSGGDAFMREAATLINQRDHPLALYVFGRDNNAIQWIVTHTHSGGVAVNDTIMHMATPGLPFGGVGPSGMGAYHGKFGFDTLSHKRTVLHRPMGFEFINQIRYAPHSQDRLNLLKRFAMSKI